jgi:hypothetical protein
MGTAIHSNGGPTPSGGSTPSGGGSGPAPRRTRGEGTPPPAAGSNGGALDGSSRPPSDEMFMTPAATAPLATSPREDPEQAFARAAKAMERASRSARPAEAGPTSDTAVGPPRPAPAISGITQDTRVDEAALRLANELRAVPGIERFGAMRLADLDSTGPRPLRAIWRIARDELDDRYGALTIGEIIDRFRGGAASA